MKQTLAGCCAHYIAPLQCNLMALRPKWSISSALSPGDSGLPGCCAAEKAAQAAISGCRFDSSFPEGTARWVSMLAWCLATALNVGWRLSYAYKIAENQSHIRLCLTGPSRSFMQKVKHTDTQPLQCLGICLCLWKPWNIPNSLFLPCRCTYYVVWEVP